MASKAGGELDSDSDYDDDYVLETDMDMDPDMNMDPELEKQLLVDLDKLGPDSDDELYMDDGANETGNAIESGSATTSTTATSGTENLLCTKCGKQYKRKGFLERHKASCTGGGRRKKTATNNTDKCKI